MNHARKLKAAGITGLCVLILCSGCESNQQKQQKVMHTKISKEAGQDLPHDQYFSDEANREQFQKQQKHSLNQVAKEMASNYKKIGSVKYDQKNIISLSLRGRQMTELIKAYKQNNSQAVKFWKELTKGMQKTSSNISKQAKDKSLIFSINDTKGRQIFSVSNGNIINDSFK